MKRLNLRKTHVAIGLIILSIMLLLWFSVRKRIVLITPAPTILFEDVQGRFIAELSQDSRRNGYWPVPHEIPSKILAATLAAEDSRYYEHSGVDVRAILRALWQNIAHLQIVSGASTIPMQVARIQHPAERTIFHKITEAITATALVRVYGHNAVIRQYLRIAPYGCQNHGIVYAARKYFAKPVEDLTWAEASLLAALPKLPGRMNLYRFEGWHLATQRAIYVLNRLRKIGKITDAEYDEALSHLPALRPVQKEIRPSICLHAILQIEKKMRAAPAAWKKHDPIIRTSIDLDLQNDISSEAVLAMQELRRDGAGNIAVIVAEKETGNVIGYLGSEDFCDVDAKGGIDYAQVPRSSGSILKPFIYALGMQERGFTAATLLTDIGLPLDGCTGAYAFHNYDDSYLGPILYRNALANSRNIPAIQVLQAVGIDVTCRQFYDLGLIHQRIDPAYYGLGLAIGGLYVKLFDLVQAYGILANDGTPFKLHWYPERVAPPSHHIIPEDIARQISLFLSDPIARLPSFPRMGSLEYPFPVAVKTGTSKGFRDAWCVAYSKKYIVGVWVGHPDNYPMKRRAGADSAAKLVHRIMEKLHPEEMNGLSDNAFPPPRGYIAKRICMLSGKLATDNTQHTAYEWFRPGTEPVLESDVYRTVKIDARTGKPAGDRCPASVVKLKTYVVLDPRFADWAKQSGLELPPVDVIRTAGVPRLRSDPRLAVKEPPNGVRLLRDPETPPEYSTIPLQALVDPPVPQVVWYVDGEPYEVVDYPYSTRWKMLPGRHTFQIKLPYARLASEKARIIVK